jgi:large subunit ribosomal protein L13
MIVIDATNLILGRLASHAAKLALQGEQVRVVNCENAIKTGDKKRILAVYQKSRDRGTPTTGPFLSRYPDRMIRRSIRGMLPMDRSRGREAFDRVMCYMGVPDDLKKEKLQTFEDADVKKVPILRSIDMKTLSKRLGAKIE